MEQGQATQKPKGAPLKSKGPIARAAKAAGISMAELARRLGHPYTTVVSWDQRDSIPDTKVRDLLSRPPYVTKSAKKG